MAAGLLAASILAPFAAFVPAALPAVLPISAPSGRKMSNAPAMLYLVAAKPAPKHDTMADRTHRRKFAAVSQDFMGRELQPLNYLGAGMGAVAGMTVGTTMSAALPITAAAAPAVLLGALAGKSL